LKLGESFFHTIRHPDGGWDKFNNASFIPNANNIADIACAGVGNELHVCLAKTNGTFFHAIRHSDRWDGFNDGSFIPNASEIKSIACAAVGGELHVCIVKNNGTFFHAIRHSDRWDGFNDGSFIPNASEIKSIACAAVGGELHVCIVKNNGTFFHAIRHSDRWDGFNDGSFIPNANDIAGIACAEVENELHVCLRKNNGAFFHAIRHSDRWDGFNDGSFIPNANNSLNTDNFGNLATSNIGNELNVCLLKNNKELFHAIRHVNSWTGFNSIGEIAPGEIAPAANIEIWFSGFRCLDESSEWSASDEPYMFLGVSTSGKAQTPYETGVIEVNAGDVIHSASKLYSGIAQDVILAAVIRENDEGDPHAFSIPFKSILDLGNKALGGQTGGITIPGEVVNLLADKLSELIGAGDDDVGRRADLLTKDYLMQMANNTEGGDPTADFFWELGSDDEGIYRLYFFVRRI
jgi:hypothetical protein